MNEDLLVTWKDIASYLKCSVRKAQRLERQHLPIKRIPNTKAVWASKTEIDQWLSHQSSRGTENPQSHERMASFRFPGQSWVLAGGFVLTLAAMMLSTYALTIVLFLIEGILLAVSYPRLADRTYARALVGLFLILGLSYAIAAASLPGLLSGTVNMTTLPPAFAYPFVVGLRFVPIPVLLCLWLIIGKGRDFRFDLNRHLRTAYLIAGILFTVVAATFGFSEIYAVWRAGLPIRWTLLAGECFIYAVNLYLLALGHTSFVSARAGNYYQFISRCGIACLLIALTAAIQSRHWIEISRTHLDVLRPQAFRVRHPDAVTVFQKWIANHRAEAGQDLVALSTDPQFLDALGNEAFYKWEFDEAFQWNPRAVVFGFRDAPSSRLRQPHFLLIRFPADLAVLVKFAPASD